MEFPLSWLERLDAEREAVIRERTHKIDKWQAPLERLRGEIGADGLERIPSQTVLDVLGVPAGRRGTSTTRRLVRLMSSLGWRPTRVYARRRGSNIEQVRGYVREAKPSLKPPADPEMSSSSNHQM
jgi:hypothetical protein